MITTDLGSVTAYADAVEQGYTGTREEFGQVIANFADSATQVAKDRIAVEAAKKSVEEMQSDVTQKQETVTLNMNTAVEAAEKAKQSASDAEASKQAAAQSEQNINNTVTAFDNHVEEKIAGFDSRVSEAVEQSKEEINTTKQQAINTITNQQDASVNIVKTEGEKIITKVGNDAKTVADDRATVEEATQTVLNNAQEVAQNTQTVASNTEKAAASAEGAKTSADNAAQSAKSVEDASKQIEQNKKDVDSLKEDKITKPAEAPTIGKILRVKSVNEDGTFVCEWADDGGSNLDVRIDEESIVQDGVANIPIASPGKPGVLGIPGEIYGLGKDSTNNIRLFGLNQTEINKRYYSKPLMGNMLDYAAKAAMCDGKGATWTADEQAAARERMGIDEWEDVITYTISDEEENSTVCYIDFEYTYKKIYVLIDESAIKGTAYMSVRFGVIGKNKLHNATLLTNTEPAFNKQQKYKTFSAEVMNTADISYRYTASSSLQLYSYCENPFIGRVNPPSVMNVDVSAIGGITWYGKMYAGTKLVVKGVRS